MLLQSLSTAVQGTGSNPELQAAALGAMTSASPILGYAQFYSFVGTTDTLVENTAVAGGAGRLLNADYTGVETAVTERTATLRIMGDSIRTDIALVRRYQNNEGVASERVRQLVSFAKGLGRHFTDQFFNGNNTAPNLDGLSGKVIAGQLVTAGGANGALVSLGNSDANVVLQQAFLAKLYELIGTVAGGAEVLVMNSRMLARLTAIARQYLQVSTISDAFGQSQIITSFNGIPIIDAGYAKNGTTLVIPNTQTKGSSSDATSIYALRFGERENVTLATNLGLQVYDRGLVGNQFVTAAEMDVQLVVQNDLAVAQLDGIRL